MATGNSVYLAPILVSQTFLLANGDINNGGTVFTYLAGTNTAANTFTSNVGDTLNPNPLQTQPSGLLASEIWIPQGQATKFVVYDAANNWINTYDDVSGVNDPSGIFQQSDSNNVFNQANAAYAQANSAYAQANLAYTAANTASGSATSALSIAENAYGQANAAYTAANNAAAGVPQNGVGSTYTLQATDSGKAIVCGGTVTVPGSTFGSGNVVTLIACSGTTAYTIDQGSGITLYWAIGTNTYTGNRTLTSFGMATIYFYSSSVALITGSGLS